MQRKERKIYIYALLSFITFGKEICPIDKKSGGGLIKDNDQSFSKNVCPPVCSGGELQINRKASALMAQRIYWLQHLARGSPAKSGMKVR